MENAFERIGSTRRYRSSVSDRDLRLLGATAGWEWPDGRDDIPLTMHWLAGGPIVPQAQIGEDGHERLGIFLPEFPPSVRMWASGRLTQRSPLRAGAQIDAETRIASIVKKAGRSGDLWFVDLDHLYAQDGAIRIEERQTLVYRPSDTSFRRGVPAQAPAGRRLASYAFDDTQLFRYSALTFNSHRIHLDRDYCTKYEGDARLVVHAPLLATVMVHEAEAMAGEDRVIGFEFRAHHPVREGERFHVVAGDRSGRIQPLWIAGDDGSMRFSATAHHDQPLGAPQVSHGREPD